MNDFKQAGSTPSAHADTTPLEIFLTTDASERVTEASADYLCLFGQSAEQVTGLHWADALSLNEARSRRIASALLEEARENGAPVDSGDCRFTVGGNRYCFPLAFEPLEDGQARIHIGNSVPVAGLDPCLCEISQTMVHGLHQAVILFEQPGGLEVLPRVLFANNDFELLTGYTAAEFERASIQGLMGSATDPAAMKNLRQALRKGEPCSEELQIYRRDGQRIWAELSLLLPESFNPNHGNQSGSAKGRARIWLLVIRDVSARHRAEDQMAQDRERLAVTLRSIGEGVITTDLSGRVDFLNEAASNISGLMLSHAQGKNISEAFPLFYEKSREPASHLLEEAFRLGRPVSERRPLVLCPPDRPERRVICNAAPILDRDQKTVGGILVFSDVTHTSKLESELLKVQKMESIALLSGGLAHDFNNILTGILGNISLARSFADPKNEKLTKVLTGAERASNRARDLTMQLLTFSKGGAPVKSRASLREALKDSVEFVLAGSSVASQIDLQPGLWTVEVDEGQLSQVLHNLLINAEQAMNGKGTVRLTARNVDIEEGEPLPLEAGRYVQVSIADSGCGIPREALSRIFDPYFTTKESGSGLGLATVYSVLRNHGGHIEVDSEPGLGTSFTFYLPANGSTPIITPSTKSKVFKGQGRVLVMDDEEMIQEICGDLLRYLGYTPAFTKSGEELLAEYQRSQESGEAYDVVILDLTIPGGMGGMETLEELRRLNPLVKALLTTGYADDKKVSEYRRHGFDGVIVKPYNVAQLSWALHQVLL